MLSDVETFNHLARSSAEGTMEPTNIMELVIGLQNDQRVVEVENSSRNTLMFETTCRAAQTASKVVRFTFRLREENEDNLCRGDGEH